MSNVRIHRHRQGDQYTVLPNALLQNQQLSFGARGLLAYLLSLPQDWTIRITEVMTHGTEGKERFYRFKTELETAGYLRGSIQRDERCTIRANVWEVTDTPGVFGEPPDSGFPDSGKPEGGTIGIRESRLPENPDSGEPPTTKNPWTKNGSKKDTDTKALPAPELETEPISPNPSQQSEPPGRSDPPPFDALATRSQQYPWEDPSHRVDPDFIEYVIKALPKKEDRAESLANARSYVRKVRYQEGRLEAVQQLWEDYQQDLEEQRRFQAEQEQLRVERLTMGQWQGW